MTTLDRFDAADRPGLHRPDFAAVTPAQKAMGYSSICSVCKRPLPSGVEIIGSRCAGPGKAAA